MKKILMILSMISVICLGPAYAQDSEKPAEPVAAENGEAASNDSYVFPDIEPEATLTAGYRIVDHHGSARADEYEYLKSSMTLGGELRTITSSHRLHLEFDIKNEKDYYGDLMYAYKNLLFFRAVNTTGFHNLDNRELFEFVSATRTYGVNRMDMGSEYGVRTGISNFLLRFKAPDFPAHLYMEANFVDKSGSNQQMFYHGGDVSRRTSRERELDLLTSVYTIGANSQLGPVAVDFSHSEKRLRVGGDRVFRDYFDLYRDRNDPTIILRTAGDYYHNLVPELKSSTNTLKLHTSMTGGIVSTATISRTDKENMESGTTATYLMGAGDFTWVPRTDLSFIAKYRHSETDIDNPDSVRVRNLTTNDVYTYSVRDSITSSSDVISGIVRYRPVKGVLLKADFTHESVSRSNEDPWHIVPDSTNRNTFSVSGDIRLIKGVRLTAKYIHKNVDNPATNIEPDRSDEGMVTLTWTPAARFHAYLSYGIKDEKRNDLRYVFDECTDGICTGEDRKVRNDRLIGTVSYSPLNNLTAVASYAYMHTKVRQDIMYEISVAPDYETDFLLPYKTTSQHYSFDVSYRPKPFIGLNAGVNHAVSEGAFYPSTATLTQGVNLSEFSELRISETTYSIGGEYQFKNGVTAGLQYRYSTFDDVINNAYNDENDGRASVVLLTLTKKW